MGRRRNKTKFLPRLKSPESETLYVGPGSFEKPSSFQCALKLMSPM